MILERLLRTLRLLLRILRLLRTPRLTDPTIPTTHTTPGTESSEAVLVSLSLSLTHQVRTASAHARVSRQHDRRGRKGSAARRHSQALGRSARQEAKGVEWARERWDGVRTRQACPRDGTPAKSTSMG